jgi:glucokinase
MMPSTSNTEKNIGIEATNASLKVVVLESRANIAEKFDVSLSEGESLPNKLAELIVQLKQTHAVDSFGIAVSGLINRLTNRVVLSTRMPFLMEFDLASELSNQTGCRIHLENDANAAGYGEYTLGAGQGSRSMFYATIGEGIGGALILDGNLWRGANGFAGEFGHIAINEDGVKLEDVASASNIVRRTRERLMQDSTSSLSRRYIEYSEGVDNIVAAANEGDDFAQLMLERTGTYIGTAIASVINLLNIEKVVIGGEVMDAGGVILESIVRRTRDRSFLPSFDAARVAAAKLGTDAPAVGAALLASRES